MASLGQPVADPSLPLFATPSARRVIGSARNGAMRVAVDQITVLHTQLPQFAARSDIDKRGDNAYTAAIQVKALPHRGRTLHSMKALPVTIAGVQGRRVRIQPSSFFPRRKYLRCRPGGRGLNRYRFALHQRVGLRWRGESSAHRTGDPRARLHSQRFGTQPEYPAVPRHRVCRVIYHPSIFGRSISRDSGRRWGGRLRPQRFVDGWTLRSSGGCPPDAARAPSRRGNRDPSGITRK